MRHLHSLESCSLDTSSVTIGSFDGVHRGHQTLIQSVTSSAHANNATGVVITFFPHPAVVLGKVSGPHYLTMPEQRAALLKNLGVDVVITLPFSCKMAALTAEEFMRQLSDNLGLQELWIGKNFRLGRDRQGDFDTLTNIGTTLGFVVKTIPYNCLDGQSISSSRIRRNLVEGNVRRSAELLGRNYAIQGTVVHGAGRGKTLGFPTANIQTHPEQLIPALGVYATWVNIGNQHYPSVSSVGYNPTFSSDKPTLRIEAHLINFGEDIYDQIIELQFVEYLRPEHKFISATDLTNQMDQDKTNAEEILAHE